MNVEIGAEAALFPEKEYINGIAFAVWLFGWFYDCKKDAASIAGWEEKKEFPNDIQCNTYLSTEGGKLCKLYIQIRKSLAQGRFV